ncbi:MAG TPA: hypothetical protein VFI92_08935 [Steroidobacteraceae bacterium]|nr:hypothetical protein [Steroidobacteraceae bacterium]
MMPPVPAFLRAMLTTSCLALAAAAIAAAAPAGADPQAQPQALDVAVFDQLKALAGRWEGRVDDATGTPVALEMAVTSNGRAVLERVFAGSPHEMTTVYFLAHDRLLATHYCSIGNQPGFELVDTSKPTDIVMTLAGGTGFDPKTDQHAHGVHLQVLEPDRLRVEWQFRKGEAEPTYARMTLTRTAAAAAQP